MPTSRRQFLAGSIAALGAPLVARGVLAQTASVAKLTSFDGQVQTFLSRLTLAEKVGQMTQADQQYPFAGHPGRRVDKQGRAGLAVQVAAFQQLGQGAAGSLIQRLGSRRQLVSFIYAHHGTGGLLLFRATGFYAKFHRVLPPFGRRK